MELNITDFFINAVPRDFSASNAEIGSDAGSITWNNALDAAKDYPLLNTQDAIETARSYFKTFGAWDHAECDAMSTQELTALLIQFIAGDIRQARVGPKSSDAEWDDYQERAEDGQCGSQLWRDAGGQIFFTLGW